MQDIPEAIAEIQSFTQDMGFRTFEIDAKATKAVLLDFIIIGQVVYYIPDDVRSAHPEIPWHLMRAMRNWLGL